MTTRFSKIEEQFNFIQENLDKNPAELALKFPNKRELISQISARQKIRKKLPEWFANTEVIFPDKLALEQASSEVVAKLKASLLSGKKLLDITGGLGVDCFYLSQRFSESIYTERQADLCEIAEWNFTKLNAAILVKNQDGFEVLKNSDADFVYVDPHRRDSKNRKMISLADCEPNLLPQLELLTKDKRTTLIKTSPLLDLKVAISELKSVIEIWVVSVRNECKEVVYILNQNFVENIEIKTFNILESDIQEFDFSWNLKSASTIQYSNPENFLYEPNASVLKSGGQDLAALKFGLQKLHPFSHLYTSENKIIDFPGKVFRIEAILKPFDKSLISNRLNVISRNFPAKANEIEKRLKLKPSRSDYLLATTLRDKSRVFIIASHIPFAKQ